MKRSSFAGLLYREYYIVRTDYIIGLITFLVSAILGILIMLSFRFGNLGLLVGDLSGNSTGMINNENISRFIRETGIMFMKYFPVFMTYVIGLNSPNAASRDTLTSWNRFVHCMPVTPLRYAAVKTAATAISMGITFLLAVSYLYLVQLASGIMFSYTDLSAVIFLLTFVAVVSVLAQIFVTLFKNRDMGYLCTILLISVPGIIISLKNNAIEEVEENPSVSELLGKAQAACPYALMIIAFSFAALFISMYLLYKRRER